MKSAVSTVSTSSSSVRATPQQSTAGTGGGGSKKQKLTETQINLQRFWPTVMSEIQLIDSVDTCYHQLPLARIKKIMKLDEDVQMISSEAPMLFEKAIDIFIRELTLRAWHQTEHCKRRTLQRSDIATAITNYDQFDFLIDIVPRDEFKKETYDDKPVTSAADGTANEEIQYILQLDQQQLS
uniref:Nuclear transcription factor Y subunit gamma n=1 Tax=Anopheles dirus TaxID=7168 RepID=A0A182N965_9DIPT